jgi:hypothetical protein
MSEKQNEVKVLIELGYEGRYVMNVEDACNAIRAVAASSGTFKKNYSSGAKYEFEDGLNIEITLRLIDEKSIKKMLLESKLKGDS